MVSPIDTTVAPLVPGLQASDASRACVDPGRRRAIPADASSAAAATRQNDSDPRRTSGVSRGGLLGIAELALWSTSTSGSCAGSSPSEGFPFSRSANTSALIPKRSLPGSTRSVSVWNRSHAVAEAIEIVVTLSLRRRPFSSMVKEFSARAR
jgi:hypothetical protein